LRSFKYYLILAILPLTHRPGFFKPTQAVMELASYPGLPTPVFVACNTNVGEGLVKLSHVQWRTWTCGGVAHSWKTASKRVHYQSQTRTIERLSAWHQTVLATFFGFR